MPPDRRALQTITSECPLKTSISLEGVRHNEFLKGVGISMYQNSGCGGAPTNWSEFGKRSGLLGPKVRNHESPDDCSPDFWNNYEADIALVKDLGSNCFRFSFEWGRLEPECGLWDESAFQRYDDIISCLWANGLEPCVTLYHFVHPWWFEEIGGFDEEENLSLFVNYCTKVFDRFGKRVKLWLTINEVAVIHYTGYVYGSHPPGGVGKLYMAGILFRNLLIAHSMAYAAMKEMPGGKNAMIGIVHDWLLFEPKGEGWRYAHIRPICKLMNNCWGNDQFIEWFTKGTFSWKPWWLAKKIHYKYPASGGLPGLDWVGLNYYSRAVLSAGFKATCHDNEEMTDMPYGIYPEGMRRGIEYCAQLGKPIYITEMGISTTCEAKREKLIRSYCDQIKGAVRDGHDVRGLMYWTLVDNFEWSYGFSKNFGLYAWDKVTNARIPRTGVDVMKDCFADLEKSIPDLKIGSGVDSKDIYLIRPEDQQQQSLIRNLRIAE